MYLPASVDTIVGNFVDDRYLFVVVYVIYDFVCK